MGYKKTLKTLNEECGISYFDIKQVERAIEVGNETEDMYEDFIKENEYGINYKKIIVKVQDNMYKFGYINIIQHHLLKKMCMQHRIKLLYSILYNQINYENSLNVDENSLLLIYSMLNEVENSSELKEKYTDSVVELKQGKKRNKKYLSALNKQHGKLVKQSSYECHE